MTLPRGEVNIKGDESNATVEYYLDTEYELC